ncbi:Uncharacterised protein [Bordetella pertussis]|nr:Uncharacterised protein [Bordetella pertussis]
MSMAVPSAMACAHSALLARTMLLSSLAVAGNAWRLRRHRWDAAPAAAVAQPAP